MVQRRHTIIQGQSYVTREDVVLSTLLGSCIAACICDRDAKVGGMNHFLLPGNINDDLCSQSTSYGAYLMEVLVNGLLKKGARRDRLEAKVFGGARTLELQNDVGARNAEFALRFLDMEGIPAICADVGGLQGRRIEYWPLTGRSRRSLIEKAVPREMPLRPVAPTTTQSLGEIEFF